MPTLFSHVPQLAARTSQVVNDFGRDFPQFAFDAKLLQPVESFVARGKLFRGSLCLLAAAELSGDSVPSEGAWAAAVALELAGSAILAQDDIMDAADLRRDEPTLHRQFARHWVGDVDDRVKFGEGAAMCMSDVLFFTATQQLIKADLPAETRLQLLEVMSTEIATLAMVQAEELRFSALPPTDSSVTEAAIIKILIGKTARYTAQWPLHFAAILAGADSQTAATLDMFGEAMGLVFQLSDDRLGLFGDPAKTGKDVDGDAKTAKKTLYALYARDQLTGITADRFNQLYGKRDLSAVELTELQVLLRDHGIDVAVAKITQTYVDQAKAAARQLNHPTLTTELIATVEFLAQRER